MTPSKDAEVTRIFPSESPGVRDLATTKSRVLSVSLASAAKACDLLVLLYLTGKQLITDEFSGMLPSSEQPRLTLPP